MCHQFLAECRRCLCRSGIAPRSIKDVIGTVKAYSTSVGSGPFVSDLRRVARAISRDLLHYSCILNAPTALAIGCADLADPYYTPLSTSGVNIFLYLARNDRSVGNRAAIPL